MSTKFLGQKFGRLTVVSRLGLYARCACECGNTCSPRMDKLREGKTKSCGCLARDMADAARKPKAPKQPRQKRTPDQRRLKAVHGAMRDRCRNPNNKEYPRYGGRGITVCTEWISFDAFYEWAKSLYKHGLWLERKDNDKGYYPENCTFATPKRQGRNRRNGLLVLRMSGAVVCLSQAAAREGWAYNRAYAAYSKCLASGIQAPVPIEILAGHILAIKAKSGATPT